MGATHLLMRALKRVRIEMALHVLAYTLARVRKILGITPLIAAIRPVGRWPIRRPRSVDNHQDGHRPLGPEITRIQ